MEEKKETVISGKSLKNLILLLIFILQMVPGVRIKAYGISVLQPSVSNAGEVCPIEKKPLIVYFSRGENIENGTEFYEKVKDDADAVTSASVLMSDKGELTGNIGLMAQWIADETGGILHPVRVKIPYPEEKKENQKIVLQEQLDGTWPDIVDDPINPDDYDTIFIGYPNWFAEPPRALYKFLEQNNLEGKTIIPFTSDDKNGFSDSVDILRSKLPGSNVTDEESGLLLNRKDLFESENKTREWARSILEKVKSQETNTLSAGSAQKEAARELIGLKITSEEIEAKVGKYIKYTQGTNG